MNFSSKNLELAVDAFATLPGIGKKTALRLALHLLQQPEDFNSSFTEAITDLKKRVQSCIKCYNLSDEQICSICANSHRNQNLICVVENVRQVMAIEDTGNYKGLYHILGGVISPIDGVGPHDLNIEALVDRVSQNDETTEVILAISPTIEGETTNLYISNQLEPFKAKISAIARGVSFGNDLEYADELTLSRSIMARQPYANQQNQ